MVKQSIYHEYIYSKIKEGNGNNPLIQSKKLNQIIGRQGHLPRRIRNIFIKEMEELGMLTRKNRIKLIIEKKELKYKEKVSKEIDESFWF